MNTIDESRCTWSIVFNNSPYTILNDTSFDVSNTSFNSETLDTYSDISLNIIDMCSEEFYKSFIKWINDIFEVSQQACDFGTSGKLSKFNENGILLQTYNLVNICPKSVNRGASYRNRSLLDIKLNCTIAHKDEDCNTRKVDNGSDKSIKETVNKKENNTMDIDIIKPITNMLDELDSLYDKISYNDDLYDEDFIDALNNYKGLLKDNPVEIIRNNCK
jgi:hypothetical protein